MGKKALAAVSFGTSYPEAREAIARVERTLSERNPAYEVHRAFTSGMIISKVKREEGTQIPTPGELLGRLADEGYEEVLCQSLHVIPGYEYEKFVAAVTPFADRFRRFAVGKPLLWDVKDYLRLTRILLGHMPRLDKDEAFVWMGHGTDHPVNAAYALVENSFRFAGGERVYVGTVEGFPNLDYILRRLHRHEISRVHLAPLMIVAGDHAQNDLAGEEEDSWKSVLEHEGYEVSADLRGLGAYGEIGEMFADKLKEAE